MSKRLLLAMLAGVAALATLVAGCGGDGDEETLTKAQYLKKGSAICSEQGEQIGRDYTAYEQQQKQAPSKADSQQVMEEIIVPGFRAEVEELQELPVPKGDEAEVEAMLAKFEAGLEEGEADSDDLFGSGNSQFTKGTELAEKYGLKACGVLFLSGAG